MTSPSVINSGTRTTAPVLRVAGLLPPCAVSPFRPGSVSVISSSIKLGGVTASGAPETRQQGSQASAEMCNDSAQTTVCSTDASAQVKPMVADSVSQAGVQVATSSSQVGERAVFRQIGENNR